MPDVQICKYCGGNILVMCRLNTGYCCEACEEKAQ